MSVAKNLICTGCGACVNVCPQNCIVMKTDKDGWDYPHVENDICANCNLCEKVCSCLNVGQNKDILVSYAAISKDYSQRKRSSSGAMFPLFAKYIIGQGGFVYGAAFDKRLSVQHIGINDVSDINRIYGSKYVQSNMLDVYPQIKKQLEEGTLVYFSGTPCQVEGLLRYLKRDYDNLITQDILCHGVPAPGIWRKYVEYLSKKHDCAEPVLAEFRNKRYGWREYSMCVKFLNHKGYKSSRFDDSYLLAFSQNFILRPSCYDCPFKKLGSRADITLGDFWPIRTVAPEFDDDIGTSLVFLRSSNAIRLFEAISPEIHYKKMHTKDCLNKIEFNKSVIPPNNRDDFLSDLHEKNDWDQLKVDYLKKQNSSTLPALIKRKIHRAKGVLKYVFIRK